MAERGGDAKASQPPSSAVQLPQFKRVSAAESPPAARRVQGPALVNGALLPPRPVRKPMRGKALSANAPKSAAMASRPSGGEQRTPNKPNRIKPRAQANQPTRDYDSPAEVAPILSDLQERRQQKNFRIRYQRFRSMAKLATCMVLLGTLAWCCRHLPIMGAPQVELANQLLLMPPSLIKRQLNHLTQGAPLNPAAGGWLLLSPEDTAQRLQQQLPFARQVTLSRRLAPNRWRVAVQEVYPWAVLQGEAPAIAVNTSKIDPKTAKTELKSADAATSNDKLPVDNDKTTTTPDKPRLVLRPTGVVLPGFERVWLKNLSADEQKALVNYLRQPAQPLTPILAEKPGQLTTNQWKQVYTLARWVQRLPGWGTAQLDVRETGNVIIKPQVGPGVQLGPLNSQWPERFARLGPLLPYWPQWTGKIASVDLRWPTQITLHPLKASNSQSSVWVQQLGTHPETPAL